MLRRIVAVLIAGASFLALAETRPLLQESTGKAASINRQLEQDRLALENKRLVLEQQSLAQRTAAADNRLAFDQQKAGREQELEHYKLLATALSVTVPALVAALAYVFQVWARRRDEQLQFQLKVAEIVMDVRDSDVARRKAQFLSQLFPKRLESLSTGLTQDNKLTYFGPSMERREELLRLLAQYPERKADIIRAWEVLFPWSTDQDWFKALKADSTLNRNAPNLKERKIGSRR